MEDRTFEELIEELQALRIRENAIIAQLEGAKNKARTGINTNSTQAPATANGLQKGDRVRIKNKIRRPATAGPGWTETRERLATVTRVTPDQVHITTDNGTRTWRGPNNLQLIDDAREQ